MTFNEPEEEENIENIMGNGENAGHQHFLHFPQCFVFVKEKVHGLSYIQFVVQVLFALDKAIVLYLEKVDWPQESHLHNFSSLYTDSVDQDQTAQNVQLDPQSTISHN